MKIELCAASPEAILLAAEYPPDRIELCQSLETGGLTPSAALVRMALDSRLETHVLIRPRPGNFVYSTAEKELMLREIRLCRDLGVQGIVAGALLADGSVDMEFMKAVRALTQNMELTFHRAMDDLQNWKTALPKLISTGVDRILTSGAAANVSEGADVLKQMLVAANGKIEVMCGGGVDTQNATWIRDTLKPDAVHFSATQFVPATDGSRFTAARNIPDADKLASLLRIFRQKT